MLEQQPKSLISDLPNGAVVCVPNDFQQTRPFITVDDVASCVLDDLVTLYQVGSGSFGSTDRVIRKITGESFALKSMDKSKMAEQKELEMRFRYEVNAQKRIQHPNIIRMHSNFEDQQYFYLLTEYADGGQLKCHLQRCRQLAEVEAAGFLADIVSALVHLHEHGIVHRDVQPKNILLVGRLAKLADFGQGRNQPVDVTFNGSMDYLSPEMISDEPQDHRVDVWAVGILLFEMLVGSPPAAIAAALSNDELQVPPNLSMTAKQLIVGLLQRDPDDRLPLNLVQSNKLLQTEVSDFQQLSQNNENSSPSTDRLCWKAPQKECLVSPKASAHRVSRLPLKPMLAHELSQRDVCDFEQPLPTQHTKHVASILPPQCLHDADALQEESRHQSCHESLPKRLESPRLREECQPRPEDTDRQIDAEALEEACQAWEKTSAAQNESSPSCLLHSGALHHDAGLLQRWNRQPRVVPDPVCALSNSDPAQEAKIVQPLQSESSVAPSDEDMGCVIRSSQSESLDNGRSSQRHSDKEVLQRDSENTRLSSDADALEEACQAWQKAIAPRMDMETIMEVEPKTVSFLHVDALHPDAGAMRRWNQPHGALVDQAWENSPYLSCESSVAPSNEENGYAHRPSKSESLSGARSSQGLLCKGTLQTESDHTRLSGQCFQGDGDFHNENQKEEVSFSSGLQSSCSASIAGRLLGAQALEPEIGLSFVRSTGSQFRHRSGEDVNADKGNHPLFSSLEPVADHQRSSCGCEQEFDDSPGTQSTAIPHGWSWFSRSSQDSCEQEFDDSPATQSTGTPHGWSWFSRSTPDSENGFTPTSLAQQTIFKGTSLEPTRSPNFQLGSALSLIANG